LKDQLYKSFVSYVKYAKPYLRQKFPVPKEGDQKIRIAHIDRSFWLRSICKNIEGSREFNNLVSDFSVACGGKPVKKVEKGSWVSMEQNAIQNFFRRSKLYLKIAEGKSINIDNYFEQLCSAFNERQVKVIRLWLLDSVYFSESIIDFGNFKIQRFSKEELDALVDNQLNHIFYPFAELGTDILSHYWFIREESSENIKGIDYVIPISFDEVFRVPRNFPDRVIQLLALFDWEEVGIGGYQDKFDEHAGWEAFSTPIAIGITDNVFASPHPSPDLSKLEFFPFPTGPDGEIVEGPQFYHHIGKGQLERLKEIVEKSQEFLQSIDLKECNWEFLDIAMGYLAKAFFAEGLEQLLWHMTVLEALFGEKNKVMEPIRKRLGYIFGKTNKERKAIGNKFDELYDFRSGLVHGNKYEKRAYWGHLREARKLARKSLLWFLTYLSAIHQELAREQKPLRDYPKKEEIQTMLDFNKEALQRIGFLIEKLPMNFPNINIWGN